MLFDRLEKQTGLSTAQIERFAQTASARYKVFTVPKKTGGVRVIEQPSRAIKSLQRWLMRAYINKLPVHPAAAAYAKGASIRNNAARHQGTNFTLRVDFADFFPSFKAVHIERFLNQSFAPIALSERDRWLISSIVCRNGGLTIGAPSSPALTNVMMFPFDAELSEWATKHKIIYSRYADDLFLSCNSANNLQHALNEVVAISQSYSLASLIINQKKTRFLSRKYRRCITGLVLTSDHKISVGRRRKEEVKSLLYKLETNRLDASEAVSLKGTIAFIRDADPDFYQRIAIKYATGISILSPERADDPIIFRAG